MNDVLILASGYCGKTTANGLCAKALVKELEHRDINVYVVSSDREKNDTDRLGRVISVHTPAKYKPDPPGNLFFKILRWLKSVLCHTWTPEYDREMVDKMVDAAKAVLDKTKIDAVVCVYFPLEAVIAGYRLKNLFPDIQFMIYELDSVADGIAGGNKWNKHVFFSYKRFLGRIYKVADRIMVLKCHERHWLEEHKGHKDRMRLVDLPLLREESLPSVESRERYVGFVYSGALDHSYRSPKTMLEALAGIGSDICWKLDLYTKGCDDVLQKIAQKEPRIVCHGYVEQAVLERAVSQSHILLSIGNKVSNSLPSKVITYMTYGKPIIHFCLQENDVCEEYLKKYPLALVMKNDERPEEMAKKIAEFIERTRGKTVDFARLEKIFPMNLPLYSVHVILENSN